MTSHERNRLILDYLAANAACEAAEKAVDKANEQLDALGKRIVEMMGPEQAAILTHDGRVIVLGNRDEILVRSIVVDRN